MKKINNNKFRGNTVYSLNYKFDSVSVAGKISGTALELIKKYNELAKEAQGNGNYVEMEVFRQYAEHYRKIVTEINERKNMSRDYGNDKNAENSTAEGSAGDDNVKSESDASEVNNGLVETERAEQTQTSAEQPEQKPTKTRRRALQVVEVSAEEPIINTDEKMVKPRRRVLKKKTSAEESAE